MSLPHGLYDLVISEAVRRALDEGRAGEAATHSIQADDAADRFLDALTGQLRRLLEDVDGDTDSDRVRRQLQLVNDLMRHVRETRPRSEDLIDVLDDPPAVLHAIHNRGETT